jgi:hypothetical protein
MGLTPVIRAAVRAATVGQCLSGITNAVSNAAIKHGRNPIYLSCAAAADVLKSIKDKNVRMVDLRFTDLPGMWQNFSAPPSAVDAGCVYHAMPVLVSGDAAEPKMA